MARVEYDLQDDEQVLDLWRALEALGFGAFVEVDPTDPHSVRDMLSDIEWYADRWGGAGDYRRAYAYHPVAGEEDAWHTYLCRHEDHVVLVTPRSSPSARSCSSREARTRTSAAGS